jgi:hypothetical protein
MAGAPQTTPTVPGSTPPKVDGTPGTATVVGGNGKPGTFTPGVDLTGGLGGAFSGLVNTVQWLTNPHNVQRIVFVVGGVAAMIAGLRMLADVGGPVGAVGGAVKQGTDVAKGAAVTAAKLAVVA